MGRYVVTAPYVTVKTMTLEGPRIVGLYVNAPVPRDVDQGWIDRHIEAGMVMEVVDPATVNASTSPMEALAGITGADKAAEQEAALNRHRGAEKAAATRKANEDAAAKVAADQAKADRDAADAAAKASRAAAAKPPVK